MTDELAGRTTVDACIAEFNALRKEIGDRSATQNTLINLNLTAIAGVVSIIAARGADQSLLLILCPISAALGMLWADHGRTIRDLGTYINEELRVSLSDIASSPVLQWEVKSREYREGRGVLLPYRLPLFLIFAGPPIAAVTITGFADPGFDEFDALLYVYWSCSTALSAYVAISLGRMQFSALQQSRVLRRRRTKQAS